MSLTDPRLPWLVGAAAVVVFVLLALGSPHWPRRPARIATRAVGALLLNVLVVFVCFLLLNNTYLFYSNWADLLGSSGVRTLSRHGGGAAAVASARVSGAGLADLGGPRAYAGQTGRPLESFTVRDAASGQSMQVLVHLPTGYDPASNRTYPVILGLHGYPGGPGAFTRLNFVSTIDRLSARGRLQRSIVVIPQINNPDGLDTECVNGPPGDPQTDTWLARELPDWVVRHFHVRTDRTSWATMGYSFGAWCAASLTIRHPDVFGAAIVLEGYFTPSFSRSYHPLTPARLRSYDLARIERTAAPPVALWTFASRQDPLAYPSTHRFLASVRPPTSVTSVSVPVGGHRASVYEPYTHTALRWLAATLPGFATHARPRLPYRDHV